MLNSRRIIISISCEAVSIVHVCRSMQFLVFYNWNKFTHMYYYCCPKTEKNILYQKNCFIRTSSVHWLTQTTGPIDDLVWMHQVSKCLSQLEWVFFLRKGNVLLFKHFKYRQQQRNDILLIKPFYALFPVHSYQQILFKRNLKYIYIYI